MAFEQRSDRVSFLSPQDHSDSCVENTLGLDGSKRNGVKGLRAAQARRDEAGGGEGGRLTGLEIHVWQEEVFVDSEGEKEIRMTPRIPTRNLTGKWLMHTSDTEGTVCSWGKDVPLFLAMLLLIGLHLGPRVEILKRQMSNLFWNSRREARLGNVELGATITQMAAETRTSLSATFFIVGPKGALLSRGPSLSGRKNNGALRSKDFGHFD